MNKQQPPQDVIVFSPRASLHCTCCHVLSSYTHDKYVLIRFVLIIRPIPGRSRWIKAWRTPALCKSSVFDLLQLRLFEEKACRKDSSWKEPFTWSEILLEQDAITRWRKGFCLKRQSVNVMPLRVFLMKKIKNKSDGIFLWKKILSYVYWPKVPESLVISKSLSLQDGTFAKYLL